MNTKKRRLQRSSKSFRSPKLQGAGKTSYTASHIGYIVVHMMGSKPDMLLNDLDQMPYHYVITKAGKLLNLKPVSSKDGTIEIALAGGLDKEGNRVDCRTPRQNEALFNVLVLLSERYPMAKIVAADKLYVYSYSNPGFDLQRWIAGYEPEFLRAA